MTPAIKQFSGNSSSISDLSNTWHSLESTISNASTSVSSKVNADVTWSDLTSCKIEFAAVILVEIVA